MLFDTIHERTAVCFGQGPHTPEKFENATLFLRLGLPSTLIRHEIELYKNDLQTGGIRKRKLCVFVWREKHFENEAFFQNDDVTFFM